MLFTFGWQLATAGIAGFATLINATENTSTVSVAERPNILMILADDQDLLMGSMNHMDAVQEQLMAKGTSYTKHYAHVSQCCPSRATLWMGRHAHNTNVTDVHNNQPGGGWKAIQKQGLEAVYLPTWMKQHGYSTYYAGKLYNGMTRELHCTPKCPGGFTEADLLLDPGMYTYYDSLFYHQQESNHDPPKTIPGYSTEHIAQRALHYIDAAVQASKPFFIVAAPIAPHEATGPHVTSDFPIPEHKYAHLYRHLGVPRDALNFNPANRSGVNHIWSLERLGQENVGFLDQYYRHRQRALKSVDVMVERLIQKLDQEGVLGQTYIIYTSDNGYHLGQHRLQGGKKQCFEEDVNVPLVIRGPGIGAGSTINTPTGHVYMAPTILKMAGAGADANPNWKLDGLAMPLDASNAGDTQNREHVNMEYWGTFSQEGKYHFGVKNNQGEANLQTYKALRIQDESQGYSLMYSVWCNQSSHELYDMTWDPYQMSNLHPSAPSERGKQNPYNSGHTHLLGRPIPQLIHRLDALILVQKTCTEHSCRQPWKELHDDGGVQNLKDSLNEQYDSYYETLYNIGKVGWERCYQGDEATLYRLQNEEPLWKDVKPQLGGSDNLFKRWEHDWLLGNDSSALN